MEIKEGVERLPVATWGEGGVSTVRRWQRSALTRSGVAAMGGSDENPRVAR
jgi:hypothetical protein